VAALHPAASNAHPKAAARTKQPLTQSRMDVVPNRTFPPDSRHYRSFLPRPFPGPQPCRTDRGFHPRGRLPEGNSLDPVKLSCLNVQSVRGLNSIILVDAAPSQASRRRPKE
jgi:hypothetical protein